MVCHCVWLIESTELNEHLSDDAGRRLPDSITGLEEMLNPNMEELAQIDNETLEVILKTDRNDETSPTSRTFHAIFRLATHLENLERSGNLRVVREKSGKIGKVRENVFLHA